MSDSDQLQETLMRLWSSGKGKTRTKMYAVLDAARDDAILTRLFESDIERACLFPGTEENDLRRVAPYLVELGENNPFTQWLLSHGWGKSWGIFAKSSATFIQLRQHFRSFFLVYDEHGNSLFFRYYDPRTFRVFLPTCDNEQLSILFSHVIQYYVEDEDRNAMIEYSCTHGKLLQHTVQLVTLTESGP